MPAGQPELVSNPIKFLSDDFNSENDMVNYIEDNIILFCNQCLGIEYKSHIREYKVEFHKKKSKSIDLLIETGLGRYIIVECKKPKHICELHNAVGQILFYHTLLKKNKGVTSDKLVIVSTKFDDEIIDTFDDFKLPILLIGIDKTYHLLHDTKHLI